MNTVLNRLQEISSAVMYAAEAHEIEVVLERIAEASRELAQTRYAALGIPDGSGSVRYFMTAGITAEERARIEHPPTGRGLLGAVMQDRQTIRLPHLAEDTRSVGFPDNHPPMDSFLGVPILAGNQLFGMLYLCDKLDGQPFNQNDQLLIETLAGFAALAIAGVELSAQQSRLRLFEERERIGMELHDGVIQSLYGIGMQVDMLRKSAPQVPSSQLNLVIDNLNSVIEDIRGFITNLRGRSRTQQKTIYQCFTAIKDRLHPPENLQFQINAPDTLPPFAPAVFESICLIVNEALSNAIRHANATSIDLDVAISHHQFLIIIRDDGRGFDPTNTNGHSGLGLHNMHQRARLYGGEISIDTALGKGTLLEIRIPVGAY